jgi:hypothetical protein
MSAGTTVNDQREIYCRKLGHRLAFAYCRSTAGGAVCSRILDCWFERFDVAGFLREELSAKDFAGLSAPPPPKVVSLVQLIDEARARLEA